MSKKQTEETVAANVPVVRETQAMVTAEDLAAWGAPQPMGQDVIIPKILPMQGLSDLVTDGKAVMGEFRDSLSGEKLGSISEPIELIPFAVNKTWDIYHQVGDKFEWQTTIPIIENPSDKGYNDLLPWADKTEEGINIKRVRRMNFFMLRPSEIEQGIALPYVFSFKSTSFSEGKKVYSQMYMRNVTQKLPPPAYTFKIGGTKEKNEHGTFIVPKVELGRRTTAAELNTCLHWFKQVTKLKVDEKDVTKEDFGASTQQHGVGDY